MGIKRAEAEQNSLPDVAQACSHGHPRSSALCRAHRRTIVWCSSLLQKKTSAPHCSATPIQHCSGRSDWFHQRNIAWGICDLIWTVELSVCRSVVVHPMPGSTYWISIITPLVSFFVSGWLVSWKVEFLEVMKSWFNLNVLGLLYLLLPCKQKMFLTIVIFWRWNVFYSAVI